MIYKLESLELCTSVALEVGPDGIEASITSFRSLIPYQVDYEKPLQQGSKVNGHKHWNLDLHSPWNIAN
ncbi:Hypothetical predicted protein [Octopus vulgaris]|uniref:Uncharacterized protein n=1 Tax=Octopus vulgaris TaxID=6645 RepID=A0AA36F324_OCTVU|nr:Hypothetical predicted protein [Octopus vulgaris]